MPVEQGKVRAIRMTDELWEALDGAVKEMNAGPIKDRAELVREFARWFTRQPGSRLPVRPPARSSEDG